jgi:hypothetical protein
MSSEPALQNTPNVNLRRWPRYKLDVPIRLIAPKGDKVSIVQGRAQGLNEGGMAVFGGMELAVDEEVAIEFTPPYTGQPIRVRAVVRNRSGYNYGLEFLLEKESDFEGVGLIRAVLAAMGSRILEDYL